MIGTGRSDVHVTITGLGAYVPERVITNEELAQMVDTSDEWIVERTGIRERRIAADAVPLLRIVEQGVEAVPQDGGQGAHRELGERPLDGGRTQLVDSKGAVLGRHDGITGFTVGQRKGLGLSGNEEPLFVLKLDAAKAQVVVGPRAALASSIIFLKEVNWLTAPASPFEARVKVRSMRPPVAATVVPSGEAASEMT